jgi:hypothetical protein
MDEEYPRCGDKVPGIGRVTVEQCRKWAGLDDGEILTVSKEVSAS